MAILALDQGQTKTNALLLAENGEILGIGMAGGASHYKDGLAKASAMMQEAADNALSLAGLQRTDITQVCGGIAAANWPEEVTMLQEEIKNVFQVENVTVLNDCVIALRAGTDSDDAIVLCTGSGMNSAVFAGGKLKLVYNNYIDLYDQGSEGLGARAFQAVFESHMCYKKPTTLEKRLMDHFGIQDMDQLMLAFYKNHLPRPLKDVAEIVFEEAAHNEPAALEIIYSFGKSISQYVIGAVKRFEVDPADFKVILSGGVFKNPNPLLYETVCSQIHRVYANIRIEQSFYEPIIGAALMALDEMGPKKMRHMRNVKRMPWKEGWYAGHVSNINVAVYEEDKQEDRKMHLVFADNTDDFYQKSAERIAEVIRKKPSAKIGLSTGRTTKGVHAALAEEWRRNPFDCSGIKVFGIDEITNMSRECRASCYYILLHEVVEPLAVPMENYIMPDPMAADLQEECLRFEEAVMADGGPDFIFLGLGENGHLGFNQPGTNFGQTAWLSWMDDSLNERLRRENDIPENVVMGGLTLGIKNLMQCPRLVMAANGRNKKEVAEKMIMGPVTEALPASVLQLHPGCEVILDPDAAGALHESLKRE